MLIYNYNRFNKVFTNSESAEFDPHDPNRPIVPLYATTIAPPTEQLVENEYYIFNEESQSWGKIIDTRNKIYYNKSTKKEFRYTEIVSEIYATLTEKTPPELAYYVWSEDENDWTYSLGEHKNFALLRNDAKLFDSLNLGVDCILSNGQTIKMDATYDDAAKMKAGIDLAIMKNEQTMNVVDYNNAVHVELSIKDANNILNQQATNYRDKWTLKTLIRSFIMASNSKEELEKILTDFNV